MVEIRIPCPSALDKKKAELIMKRMKEPLNGMLKKNMQTRALKTIEIIPKSKYGIYLLSKNWDFFILVVLKSSMVPFSHSLAITREVKSVPTRVIEIAKDPGRINHRLFCP